MTRLQEQIDKSTVIQQSVEIYKGKNYIKKRKEKYP